MPVLVLLRTLAAQGWTQDGEPRAHTALSERHYGDFDYVARRSYLQCLVSLDTLLQRGLLCLPTKRSENLYKQILVADSPSTLIDQSVDGQCSMPEGGQAVLRGSSDIASGQSSDIASAPVSKRHRTLPVVSLAALSPSVSGSGSGHTDVQGQAIGSSVEHPAAAASSVDPTDHTEDSGSDSDSGSSSGTSSASGATSDVEVIVSRTEWKPQLAASHKIAFDEFGQCGQAGHYNYRRLYLKCPLAGEGHFHCTKTCKRWRNIGSFQCSQFGAMEPELFLLAWADNASQFESRDAHMKFKPSKEDLDTALRKYGGNAQGNVPG